MPLVVLNVAYPFTPVGPDAADDAVRTVVRLDSALVRAGHESVVMACEGSVIEGILLETHIPSPSARESGRQKVYDQYRFTLRRFLDKWPIDIIHMHGVDFYEYLPPAGVPVLVTLHSAMELYPERVFHLERPHTFLNCASAGQRQNCPPCADLLPEVEPDGDATWSHVIDRYLMIYEKLVNEFSTVETRVEATAGVSFSAEGRI